MMSDEEMLKVLAVPFCFWLDKDGEKCPRCGKLHMPCPNCDGAGFFEMGDDDDSEACWRCGGAGTLAGQKD